MPIKSNIRSPLATPPIQSVTATIDLHGYRKSEGIVALTAFLDHVVSQQATKQQGAASEVWVLVITGSGAHSPEGPVLRTAIQSVLEKRKMQFLVNRGKGSFTVNANSGIVFYEPGMPVDSKVIVKEAPEVIPKLPKPPRIPMVRSVCNDEAPTPHEVAATEKALDESKKDQQRIFQEQKKEEHVIKRAVSMSLLHAQKEEEEEQQLLHRALSMSLLDSHAKNDTNLDEDLQRALELSQKDFQHDESKEIELALRLSQQIACREDDELLQILELSKNEYQLKESWTIGLGADEFAGDCEP